MKRMTFLILLSLTLAFSGCDSSSGGGSEPGEDTTVTPGEDTLPGEDTAGPVEDEHPHWPGVAWDTFWPAAGESAVYAATTVGGALKDVTARVERDVEWNGEIWTRIVAGTLEPGQDGVAIYLDDSDPWQVRAKGIEAYSAEYADGPSITEFFEDPIVIPLAPEVDTPTHIETTLKSTFYGEAMDIGVVYDNPVKTYDGEVTVPFGTLDGCIILEATITGDLGGPDGFVAEVIAHPEQRNV
jgi:hypothetical protein